MLAISRDGVTHRRARIPARFRACSQNAHIFSLLLFAALAFPAAALAAAGSRRRPAAARRSPTPRSPAHRAAAAAGRPLPARRSTTSPTQIRAEREPRPRRAPRSAAKLFADLPGGVSIGTLESIASCESGGDPTAVSSDGTYRGKYQFDYGTWESVGGHGDPAAAPEAEQDYRAALLYSRSGSSPWPVCG